jgi:CBS domain-containing protein
MRAHQIMTREVITARPDMSVVEAAGLMLRHHISGLPVVDAAGRLIGVLSEGDFMRRSEIGTERPRIRWLDWIAGPGKAAAEYVHEHGRKVGEIMTRDDLCTVTEDMPVQQLVRLMERRDIKRLPVVRGGVLVGIVTRSDLLRAVASLARAIPDPTADDDHIRDRVMAAIGKHDWKPMRLDVVARDGIVHISGIISEESCRQACMVAAENVAGVRLVHDHLDLLDPASGLSFRSPEDEDWAKIG